MLTTSIFAVALVAGSAVAQSTSTGSTALNYTYIDVANVDPQEAASWCIGQRTGCQTLCDGNAPTNDCDAQKLTFKCLCEDGSTPDLAKYKDTLPDRVCQANFAGCIKAHPNDAVGQGKCKSEIQNTCGTLSITDYEKGSGSGSGSDATSSGSAPETAAPSSTGGSGGAGGASETTGGSTPSNTDGSAPAATSSDSAAVAMINGMDIGAGVLAAGLLGVFGYIL